MNYATLEDNQLIQRFGRGDSRAFEALYERHKGPSYRFVKRQLPPGADADDMFQELWSRVIKRAAQYSPEAKFTTWLYTIARNLLIDNNRHLKVVEQRLGQAVDEEVLDSQLNVERQSDNRQQIDALRHCLQRLPPLQRESFLMREEAALSSSEIAEVVGANAEAIKSRIKTAIANLRQCLVQKLGLEVA